MSTEPKEASDQNNSEPAKDDDKSDEFLNFERGMKHVFGLNKKQVKDVIRRSPNEEKEQTGSGDNN